jgi:hypothetical protein
MSISRHGLVWDLKSWRDGWSILNTQRALDMIGMGPEYRHGLGWDLKIWSDGLVNTQYGPWM